MQSYYEEKNYLSLLSNIVQNGSERQDRTGTGTRSIFGTQLRFSLENNKIPMLTTKKIHSKSVIEELLFFLRGDTDTKKLEEKGVNIWKGNTTREFLDKRGLTYLPEGDMGKGYGYQWRKFGEEKWEDQEGYDVGIDGVDQLNNLIHSLKKDPYSRRHIISAWNPNQLNQMALPPCHIIVQYYVDNGTLSSHFYMRSVDTFLGLPFNIMSYGIMNHIIAKAVGMKSKELVFTGGDTHVYLNHLEQVNEQIGREPYPAPTLEITKEINSVKDIELLSLEDFTINNYVSHPAIKATMAV
jgi:thymidylate synthase